MESEEEDDAPVAKKAAPKKAPVRLFILVFIHSFTSERIHANDSIDDRRRRRLMRRMKKE